MNSQIEFNPMGPWTGLVDDVTVTDIDSRLTRTHYFDGRLLTAEDLNRDQVYLDERLRELGRAHGSGIVNGLECSLESGRIEIGAGRALAGSGRLLEMADDQVVDLNNAAAISGLNDGKYRHLNRGLYALVLRYDEEQQELAEVFPTDLGAKRQTQSDVYAEGINLALVSLPVPLQQDDEFVIRERLIWSLSDNLALIPEDGVALGVLAIADDAPLWFDAELLRHPLRTMLTQSLLNSDQSRRHQALFNDIVAARRDSGYQPRFNASEYFNSLPPVGPLPKASVRPELGTQGYFPDSFRVSIAPINRADIAAVRAESMPLLPLQLHSERLQEVMILAPLDDVDYAYFAQLLETESLSDGDEIEIPIIKPVVLSMAASLSSATADPNWQALWERVNEQELFFVRRPGRAAETGVSAIVLARGSELPSPPSPPTGLEITDSVDVAPTQPAPVDSAATENETILRRINLERLAKHRPPLAGNEQNAFNRIAGKFAEDAKVVLLLNDLLLRIERRYDAMIWRTLAKATLEADPTKLRDYLSENQKPEAITPQVLLDAREKDLLPMTETMVDFWKQAAEAEA